MNEIVFWLLLTLLFIAIEAFFTMSEMSFVSFDRVRLHFLETKGNKKAKLLIRLLEKPIFLFGTTLVGVNAALITGSECSRQLYNAMGLPEGLAPITQVIFVVIFAELCPLFAARRHFQTVAFFCVPVIYFLSKVFYPLLLLISWISKGLNLLLKGNRESYDLVLTRDELQNILERVHTKRAVDVEQEQKSVLKNIFKIKHTPLVSMMLPLSNCLIVPKKTTIGDVKSLLKDQFMPFVLVYDKKPQKMIKIVFSKELMQEDPKTFIETKGELPWFVSQDVSALELLKQLRSNMRFVACILDEHANAIGVIRIDDVFKALFPVKESNKDKTMHSIDVTLDADCLVIDFNKRFKMSIKSADDMTMQELLMDKLGHVPKAGEAIQIEHLEIRVMEANVFSAKTLLIRSVLE